jgi:hypothetical protein
MKIVELLVEGYSEQLEVDLNDLLAAAKGRDAEFVSTDQLVSSLVSMGHNVNSNSIMTVLKGNSFVQSATPDQVQLKRDDEAGVSGDEDSREDNEMRVSQMAQQAVDI